jgi:hypothetical protein
MGLLFFFKIKKKNYIGREVYADAFFVVKRSETRNKRSVSPRPTGVSRADKWDHK